MKKILIYLLVIALVVSLVLLGAGCKESAAPEEEAESAAPEEEVVTITIWDWQAGPVYENVFNELIPAFEEKHPNIKVERTGYTLSEWDELIKSAIQSDSLPDLFGLFQGVNLLNVADTGILYSWDEAINSDPEWKENYSVYGAKDLLDRDGNTVALAYDIFYSACFGFRNILEEMGRTEEDVKNLKTAEDFVNFSQELKAEGHESWYMIAGFIASYLMRELFYTMAYAEAYPDDIGFKAEYQLDGVKWTDEVFINAARALGSLSNATREDVLSTEQQTDAYTQFLNQDSWAALYEGSWSTGILLDNPVALENAFVFRQPLSVEGANEFVMESGPGQIVCMEKDNPNKDQVIEFMKFFHSPEGTPYLIKNLTHPAGKFPDDWENLISGPAANLYAEFKGLYDESVEPHSWWVLNAEIEASLIDNLVLVWIGDLTPEEAMANVQADTEAFWASQ